MFREDVATDLWAPAWGQPSGALGGLSSQGGLPGGGSSSLQHVQARVLKVIILSPFINLHPTTSPLENFLGSAFMIYPKCAHAPPRPTLPPRVSAST